MVRKKSLKRKGNLKQRRSTKKMLINLLKKVSWIPLLKKGNREKAELTNIRNAEECITIDPMDIK